MVDMIVMKQSSFNRSKANDVVSSERKVSVYFPLLVKHLLKIELTSNQSDWLEYKKLQIEHVHPSHY